MSFRASEASREIYEIPKSHIDNQHLGFGSYDGLSSDEDHLS